MPTEHEKNCIEVLLKTVMLWVKGNCSRTFVMYANKILKKYDDFFCIDGSKKKPSLTFLRKYNIEYKNVETNKILNQTIKIFIDELYEDFLNDENFHKFVKYMKKWEATPKYIIGKEETTKINNNLYKCYRIIANKDIPTYANSNNGYQLIKKGTPGGCIKSEENLSQKGFCWLNNESYILGKAKLEGNSYLHQSYLYGHAKVEGNSKITFSIVCQNATVKGHNDVHMSRITGNVIIQDDVYVHSSNINDNVEIFGSSYIYFSNLSEDIWVEDSLLEHINKNGNQKIKGENLCKNTN